MKEKVQYIPAPEAAKILGLAPQTLANQRFRATVYFVKLQEASVGSNRYDFSAWH